MGLFSNVLKRVKEGVEPRRGPRSGIGTLTRRPDLEPRGGGFLKRAARNLNQQIGPQPSPMLPIMPPSIPLTPVQARRQELENLGYDAADVQEILERDQVRGLGNVTSNVLPSIPIAPPPVIPQIPQPLPQIPSPLPTPPPPINIGGPPLDTSLIPEREILERPIIPPSRGIIGSNPIIESGTGGIGARPDLPQLPRSSLFGGKGMRDDFMFIERLEDPIKDIQPPVIPDTTPPPVVDPAVITPPVAPSPVVTPPTGSFRTADFQDTDMNGVDDRDQQDFGGPSQEYLDQQARMRDIFGGGTPNVSTNPVTPPVTPPPVITPQPVITEPVVTPEPKIQPAPTTELTQGDSMQPINVSNQDPFAASVTQVASGLDPLTEQLLFGLGGQGGFIPGAMRAAEKVFYDDQGNPVVIDEQVAGFSPDQLQAMQMQREALGIQNPFLQRAGQAFGAGTQALEEGLQRGRTAAIGALDATRGGVGSLQSGLGESADILRSTLGGYDPSMTSQFYDPFEDRVVQQTIEDIMEQGAKSDIGARASDIARGGESAFGSRARLGASERQEALGRGLAEALGGIRSRGFQQAQQTGLGEFARQKAAERAASSGLASLAGQGFGGSQALAGALSGLGQTEQDIGQQRYSGQFGLGTGLQGLGAQAAGASASDIAALYGMGAQQQGQTQQMLDAQRRNLQQRQMTPLLQYQALAPFVSMAPAGQFQTTTQFAPRPSAMQTGIGTGLAAFGALGNLYGGN